MSAELSFKGKKKHSRFIAYDPFIKEFEQIRDWTFAVEAHLAEIGVNQPLPYRLIRATEGPYGFNISHVVESALMKMARDLAKYPLELREWNYYYERYVDVSRDALDESKYHAGEKKVWISERSFDDIMEIVSHAQRAGVTFQLFHHQDSPRFRLIVALAIMYTAEHLPPVPDQL